MKIDKCGKNAASHNNFRKGRAGEPVNLALKKA